MLTISVRIGYSQSLSECLNLSFNSTLNSIFTITWNHGVSRWQTVSWLGSWHSCGIPGLSSWPPISRWSSPTWCERSGSKWIGARVFSPSFSFYPASSPSFSLPLKWLKQKVVFCKKVKVNLMQQLCFYSKWLMKNENHFYTTYCIKVIYITCCIISIITFMQYYVLYKGNFRSS